MRSRKLPRPAAPAWFWFPDRCRLPQPAVFGSSRSKPPGRCAQPSWSICEAATIIIKAAAVADYHVAEVPKQKMKKTATRLSLELDPTPDILAEVGQKKGDRLLIGFAAETQNLIEEARRKLKTKNCDMVVGNLVSRDDIGFEIGRQRSCAGSAHR